MPVDRFEVGKWYIREDPGIPGNHPFVVGEMYQVISVLHEGRSAGFLDSSGKKVLMEDSKKLYTSECSRFGLAEKPTLVESLSPPPDPPPPPTVEQPEDPELIQALRRFETGQMEAAVRRFLCGVLEEE